VDFALKQPKKKRKKILILCFNPCFGGFCSKTKEKGMDLIGWVSFNPCFGGFCSKTTDARTDAVIVMLFQSLFWWILL